MLRRLRHHDRAEEEQQGAYGAHGVEGGADGVGLLAAVKLSCWVESVHYFAHARRDNSNSACHRK